jgi:simple sugar transport system ATP-binding protein
VVETVRLSVRDVDVPVRALSGGHAQRLLTGRELAMSPRVLILTYPTRGLDVKAIQALRAAILDARRRAAAILLISEDLDELLELSDRILVLYEGQIVGEFAGAEASSSVIGALMSGAHLASRDAGETSPA